MDSHVSEDPGPNFYVQRGSWIICRHDSLYLPVVFATFVASEFYAAAFCLLQMVTACISTSDDLNGISRPCTSLPYIYYVVYEIKWFL